MSSIRPYQTADSTPLTDIYNLVYPNRPLLVSDFHRMMRNTIEDGGFAWVIEEEGGLIGYAAVAQVPSLEHLLDLNGLIAPQKQRQGYGSLLLAHLIKELKKTPIRQLVHCLAAVESPANHFLSHHQFFVEHEEWLMELSGLGNLPSESPPKHREKANITWATFHRSKAIKQFCRLYEQSFFGLPWYQPYTQAEVAASLEVPSDLLFLLREGRAIGFAWTQKLGDGTGQIEPMGVIKPYQGQGYGRLLLLKALNRFARQGIDHVKIGTWLSNQPALHLYRSLGFQPIHTITYLSFNLY